MKRPYILLLLLFTFAVLLYRMPKADAESGFFGPNCATSGCHAASPSTCDGCHAHGVHSSSAKSNINIAGTPNKTTYAPGETVSVTIDGGYRTGWVRAILYDQNMNELARSTGTATGGKGGGPAFPTILTAPAPATGGTYTWKVAWYGNQYDKSAPFFQPACSATITTNCWKADTSNANHGQEIRSIATFTVAAAGDTTAPTVTSFTVPPSSNSLTVPITAISATDNVGVTGYLINESSATPSAGEEGWSSTAPASYSFGTGGTKTLYAWAKDAAGNVSAGVNASVNITIAPPPPPPPTLGSVIAPATSGIYWDDVNKTLTIDSSNPIPSISVTASGVETTVYMAGAADYNPQLIFEMARGTLASPTAVQNGDFLGSLGINAYNGSAWEGNRKAMQIEASEPWTMTNGGYRIVFYTRDNGTVGEPFESMRIEDNGNVGLGTAEPGQKLEVNGGVRVNTIEPRPVCDADSRGTFWFMQDDINGDSADVCAKVSGSYGWKRLF